MQNLKREMVLKPLPTFDLGSQKYVGEGVSSMTTVSDTTNEAASQNSKIDNDDEEESRARHQCRPYLIFEIVKTLSERDGWGERLAYFKTTGFGDVLRIAHWKSGLPCEFVKFVVDNFEAKEMRIRLGANHVLALHDTDVKRVYNLPLGGTEVNVIRCDKNLLSALKKDLGIEDGTSSKIVKDTVIAEALLRETDNVKWSKLMILYILGTLLCPSNHASINMDYANLLEDVQIIKGYDWCGHVLKYMQSGISYQGCRSPKADFHFLLINYLDRMAAESPLETGRFQVPTCDLLDYERSRKRLKKIGEIMSLKNGVTFGWTSTCTANVPITFDLDNCPFEKVSVYADWVRLQLSIYTKMLQTLEKRMEKEGIHEADEHKKKKLAAGRKKSAMKRIAKRAEVNKPAKRAKLGKGKTPAIQTNDVENVVTVSCGNPNEAENVLEDPTAIHGDELENALIGSGVNPNEPENVLGGPMEKVDVDVTNLENAEPSMIPNVTESVEDNGPLVTDRVVDSNISSMKKSNYARKKKNVKEQTSEKSDFWTTTPGEKKDLIFCESALSSEDKTRVENFARAYGVNVSTSWNQNITHVIASTDDTGACIRTFEFLMAILNGKWIVKVDWIKACTKENQLLDESDYEIGLDNHGYCDGPKIGRLHCSENGPKLFAGLRFYFSGDFDHDELNELSELVEAAGGIIESKEGMIASRAGGAPESHYVVYDCNPPKGKPTGDASFLQHRLREAVDVAVDIGAGVLRHRWISDSIAGCKLIPLL